VSVPCFVLFLCFRKVTQEIFPELDETKAKHPKIYRSFQRTEEETEKGHRAAIPPGARPAPSSRPPVVRPSWSTSGAAPSPIKTPRREIPKHLITFPETHRDPPPSSTRDREDLEALPGNLSERGIATGGLLYRHACLRRDE
jgi:hypothetical protein